MTLLFLVSSCDPTAVKLGLVLLEAIALLRVSVSVAAVGNRLDLTEPCSLAVRDRDSVAQEVVGDASELRGEWQPQTVIWSGGERQTLGCV